MRYHAGHPILSTICHNTALVLMSSSEDSENFRSPNGSPEREGTLRRSRRIALAGRANPAETETLNLAIESQLDTVRNALQDTVETVNRSPTDFVGFPQNPEVHPPVGERIDTPRANTLLRRKKTPQTSASSLLGSRISLFEGRTGSLINVSGTRGQNLVTRLTCIRRPAHRKRT